MFMYVVCQNGVHFRFPFPLNIFPSKLFSLLVNLIGAINNVSFAMLHDGLIAIHTLSPGARINIET